VSSDGEDTTPPARGGGYGRLQATERWLRTNPRQVSLLVVVLVVTVPFFQQSVGSLWLVFTYSLSVALAGYGLGLRGGVATALVATALLYKHAIQTLAHPDTLFVVTTRLAGNLLITALTALAAATVRAREEYLLSRSRLAQLQDDLVAAFAHDVRSPLAAILGYASMLREETESGQVPPDLVATLCRIEANAMHEIGGFDERALLGKIAKALDASRGMGKDESRPVESGVSVRTVSFERLVQELANDHQLFVMDRKGTPIGEQAFTGHPCFLLTDHIPMPKKTFHSLERLGAVKLTLGPTMLFASQCIVLIHHALDQG